jgi:hypothetical protein
MFSHPNAGLEDRCVLTPPQQQVVELLSPGATVTAPAESVSIHRNTHSPIEPDLCEPGVVANTVSNWNRSSPSFRSALSGALTEKALLRRRQIAALVPPALENLRSTLADPANSAGVRLSAALAILDRAAAPPSPNLVQAAKSLVTLSPGSESVHNLHSPATLPVVPNFTLTCHHIHASPASARSVYQTNPVPFSDTPSPTPAQESKSLVTLSPQSESLHNLHNPGQSQAKNERSNPILTPTPPHQVGRNQACPCGAGRRYKKCGIDKTGQAA